VIRTVLLSLLLGAGGGFAAMAAGGSQDLSMIATFCGAIAPLMWFNRHRRTRNQRSD
jgi:hypothetical protein